MPLAGFLDYITPIEHFFVRAHVYTPRVDLEAWRLQVGGDVATPLTLTMEELRRLPSAELVSVLECAGNGRGNYDPPVPGVQWIAGAVGNGRWRGVRLADVLQRAGVKDSAREVLFNGADVPLGTMPDFQRSLPIAKALDPNTLLAYEMNGETLPPKHGFPLRVVAPGWAGDSWVKWVSSISVLDHEHDGFWMARAYRRPPQAVRPGSSVPLEQMRPVTSLPVKSVIATPVDGADAAAGAAMVVRGAAWSGDAGPVNAVDVSVDGGRHWTAATIQPHGHAPFGWVLWEHRWTPMAAGYYTILARARDAAGNIQPLDQEWNPSGYNWNVVPRVAVNVVADLAAVRPQPQPAVPAAPDITTAPPAFTRACTACHDADMVRQQRLTRAQWDSEVNKMVSWGAKVNDVDRQGLIDYLFANFGRRSR